MLCRDRVPGVASSTPSCPLPALSGGGSCGYRFKNPSLGKTLMINQAADPSATASSEREGGSGREGVRRQRRAEWPSAEGKSPAVGGGRLGVSSLPAAGAGPEPGEAGAGSGQVQRVRGSGRSRAEAGGLGVCGLLSPDVRRRRPRPERAPWGPRSWWRWAPSTTWHFSCNSAAPRGPPATRPGTTTSPATVSSVATLADFPHQTPPRAAPLQLGGPWARTRTGRDGGPGAPPAGSMDPPWQPGHPC